MKIVHLSYSYVSSCSDPVAWLNKISHSTGVLEHMAQHDEVIGIYHINNECQIVQQGVTYRFTNYKRWQLLIPFKFNCEVKKLKPDAVVVHGLISPWQILLLRLITGRNLIILAQHHAEKPLRDIRQYFQRWADHYYKAYLFCSVDLGLKWVDAKQIHDRKKIKEVMGTSSIFKPMERKSAREFTKVTGETIFLWVGRLDANKDPLIVARAFIRLMKQKPAAKLYMIYQTFELLDQLKELVSKTQEATDSIQLIGKINYQDLGYWYNSADFIISSSHYEGSGIAVCEGLSCGCIPILTNIPSFRMMTDNGRVGFLYEPGDAEGLSEAMVSAVNANAALMRNEVLNQFNRKLSFEANARQIRSIILE